MPKPARENAQRLPASRQRQILWIAAAAAAIAWLMSRAFVRVVVSNRSMLPNLHPGDRLLVDRSAYHWRRPRRGDVVLFRHAGVRSGVAIKRVIGLPGERIAIRQGRVFIDEQTYTEPYVARATPALDAEWRLGADEYLLLGDNRAESQDSRQFGPVRRTALLGRVNHRYVSRTTRRRLASAPKYIDIRPSPCQNARR